MQADRVKFHVLFRDTITRLDVLSKAVRECRNLDEAADFAKYVLNSVAPLLKTCPFPEPIPCDGHLVGSLAQTLLSAVQDRWRLHDMQPRLDLSELTAVNRKLDLIAAHVARISPMAQFVMLPPIPQSVPNVDSPAIPEASPRSGEAAGSPNLVYTRTSQQGEEKTA